MGQIRKRWRDHLGIDDDQLRFVLQKFRILSGSPTIERLRDFADTALSSVGLVGVDHSKAVIVYETLPWKWHAHEIKLFDSEIFERLCKEEGLVTSATNGLEPIVLGIRTFIHPIDDLVRRSDELCDLRSMFEGRKIKQSGDWQFSVAPKVASFLTVNAQKTDLLRLILDAHVSVAIAAGVTLNVKSGKKIEIEQRSNGRNVWYSSERIGFKPHGCDIKQTVGRGIKDIILEVSLSRNISSDVHKFVVDSKIDPAEYISLQPSGGASSFSVTDGEHAFSIAEALVEACRNTLVRIGNNARFHLFFSGPNSVAFYIGQIAVPLGCLTVYEYDFEQSNGGGYSASLSLPM